MSELTNCKTELKSGLMSSTKLLSSDKTMVINEYHDQKSDGYCNKCGKELYDKYKSTLLDEKNKITSRLEKLISAIPVISTHSPLNWNYRFRLSGQESAPGSPKFLSQTVNHHINKAKTRE